MVPWSEAPVSTRLRQIALFKPGGNWRSIPVNDQHGDWVSVDSICHLCGGGWRFIFPAVLALTDKQFFMLAVFVYGLSTVYSVFLWRKGFRKDDRINYALLLLAGGLHTMALIGRGFSLQRCPVNNLYEAVAFVGWTITTTYLVVGAWPRLRFLGAFAAPVLFCLGVFALFPALDQTGTGRELLKGWESLHAALILLSYGAFGLGFVAGTMYLTQAHDLKFDKLRAVLSLLPSIDRLEKVISRFVLAGLILLTVGLLLGVTTLRQRPEAPVIDMKVVWSAGVWLMYAALLVTHRWFAQGGRRFAWGAIASFAFVILTFWGTNLASKIHQP